MADATRWFRRQWEDIKGNFKWWLLSLFGGGVLTVLRWAWRMVHHVPLDWLGAVVTFIASAVGLVVVSLGLRKAGAERQPEDAARRPHLSLDVSPTPGRYYGKWEFVLRNDSDELAINVVVHDIKLPVPEAVKRQYRIGEALIGREADDGQPEWVIKFQMGVGDVPQHGGTKPVCYSVYGVGPLHGQDLAKAFESCDSGSEFRCEMKVDFSSVAGMRWRSRFGLTYHHPVKAITAWYIGTEKL